jgi:hypothetical protein
MAQRPIHRSATTPRPRLSKRAQRPPLQPADALSAKFEAAILQFSAEFLRTEGFQHALTKGEQREEPVREFLRQNLPDVFGVATGEVLDSLGAHSPQLDVLVFDRIRNFPVHRGSAAILPAEALLASFEVKSMLTIAEIERSLVAAAKLRALRPFKRPLLGPDRGKTSHPDECRYFHSVFAYHSDLAADGWLRAEHARLLDASKRVGIAASTIDRIYVAQRGLIHPERTRGIAEDDSNGLALMNLFAHVLNFIVRENGNRKAAPSGQYFGRLATGWESLGP